MQIFHMNQWFDKILEFYYGLIIQRKMNHYNGYTGLCVWHTVTYNHYIYSYREVEESVPLALYFSGAKDRT